MSQFNTQVVQTAGYGLYRKEIFLLALLTQIINIQKEIRLFQVQPEFRNERIPMI